MQRLTKLNRFTSLPILLDLLQRKKLVFTNPEKWEDKNDVEILAKYKEKKELGTLLLVCFTHETETIHHWKAFSNGMSGCCIEFDYAQIMKHVNKNKKIRHDVVDYLKINQINPNFIDISEVPFKKRYPYRIESEYRFLYESKEAKEIFELDIRLDTIKRITFSQDIPGTVLESIRSIINGKEGMGIKIVRSTVYQNDRWINAINKC
jgi:hypothetical protein